MKQNQEMCQSCKNVVDALKLMKNNDAFRQMLPESKKICKLVIPLSCLSVRSISALGRIKKYIISTMNQTWLIDIFIFVFVVMKK
jgi:hypothetical protein